MIEYLGSAFDARPCSTAMSAAVSMLVLFGLSCPQPCPIPHSTRARMEQDLVAALTQQGFEVRPAGVEAVRPTGDAANLQPKDEAAALHAARVVVLDVEPERPKVWITHFVRGSVGPWSVRQHTCTSTAAGCLGLVSAVQRGMRPRTAQDVDFVGVLRRLAKPVGRCVAQEDRVAPALRLFGRVDLDLEVSPEGAMRVVQIAPSRAARGALGACLKRAAERVDVGPFEGQAVRMRIPLDL